LGFLLQGDEVGRSDEDRLSHRPFGELATQIDKIQGENTERQAEPQPRSGKERSKEKGEQREKRKDKSREGELSHRPFSDLVERLGDDLETLEDQRQSLGDKPAPPEMPRTEEVDDELLLRREMSGVRPIDQLERGNYVPNRRGEVAPPERTDEAEAMAQLADLVSGRGSFDLSATDEHVEGIAVGLDRRLLKRLRKGYFAVQAHIDLHGRTRLEARQLVEEFLLESRMQRRRCVLIVHGRGLNSKDQIPVLKESLKVWLAKGRIARSVLAFTSARPSDGGAGAVYVLLRK
jgi:DNA-nicking Smr family endonuclease